MSEVAIDPAYTFNVVFGHVDIQSRPVAFPDGSFGYESRRLTYDREGVLTETSEWSDNGCRITGGGLCIVGGQLTYNPRQKAGAWWEFWK
jgi:hypothetical protein